MKNTIEWVCLLNLTKNKKNNGHVNLGFPDHILHWKSFNWDGDHGLGIIYPHLALEC